MTYSELHFKRDDQELVFPDLARQFVSHASRARGITINPAFFNYGVGGKTLSGNYGEFSGGNTGLGIPPKIVFGGGKGLLRIYGIGQGGSDLITSESDALIKTLFPLGFRQVDRKDGQMSLKYSDSVSPLHSIHCLVVKKSKGKDKKGNQRIGKDPKRFEHAPLEGAIAEEVKEVILRGISGVARMLDEELLARGLPPEHERSVPHDLEILDGRPCPVPVKGGALASAYKHVLFSMPYQLNGPWVTGFLRARGYGLIRRINPTTRGSKGDE